MYLSTSTSTSTFNVFQSKNKSKYSSKNIDKFKYFVKISNTSTKYFENFSKVQSSTLVTVKYCGVAAS